jgi:hypothetical protein
VSWGDLAVAVLTVVNLHNIQLTILTIFECTAQGVLITIRLAKLKLVPIKELPHHHCYPSPSPWQPPFYSLSCGFDYYRNLSQMGSPNNYPFMTGNFTKPNVLKDHLCGNKCQNVLPF